MTDSLTGTGLGRELPADRYHTGVRLATLVLWLAAVVALYLIGQRLWHLFLGPVASLAEGFVLAGAAVIAAQPLVMWAEKQLITRWRSGRAIQLGAGGLVMREKDGEAHLDLGQKVNYWRWRFEIRRQRGGRVPNGHSCFALRLVQADTSVSLYAFLSPAQAQALLARRPFYDLRPATDKSRTALGGRDATYLAAERERWISGAELDSADFDVLLTHLARHISDFSSSPSS